jgi:hypothetical protein
MELNNTLFGIGFLLVGLGILFIGLGAFFRGLSFLVQADSHFEKKRLFGKK